MATVLAQQLKNIIISQHGTTRRQPRGKPSLIFTPQQAADVDLFTIYSIGLRGLAGLSEVDGRFEQFSATLFSHDATEMDREKQTQTVNEKMNASISSFLSLLSSYLLLTPAHQTLEYLIRRYKIHVYNVDAVMACVLPYHETNLFVRIVQLLQIEHTRWEFLMGVQENGTALPREVLVARCTKDMAVLDAICEMANIASDAGVKSHTVVSFCTVMAMEVLGAVNSASEALVMRILPFILEGFKNESSVEIQAGALMATVQLASRATLSEELATSLIKNILKMPQLVQAKVAGTSTPPLLREALMAIIHITQTQPMGSFPGKVMRALLKIREFSTELASLSEVFKTSNFMAHLLRFLVKQSAQQKKYEEKLIGLIEELPMENQVGILTSELVNLCFKEQGGDEGDEDAEEMRDADPSISNEKKEGKARAMVRRVLSLLDKRYPLQLDEAVNNLMKEIDEGKKNAANRLKGSDTDEEPANELEETFKFFSEVLHGSLHAPLVESNASLYLSVDHPQARIREMAIKKLGNVLDQTDGYEGKQQVHVFLRDALLRRLLDDNPNVVKAVLSLRCIVEIVPTAQLLEALTKTVDAAESALNTGLGLGENPCDAITVIKAVLNFMGTTLLTKNPKLIEKVSIYLLGFFFPRDGEKSLSKLAVELASAIQHPLFSKLNDLCASESKKANQDGKKKKDSAWRGKVIQAMASAILAMDPMSGRGEDGEDPVGMIGGYMRIVSSEEIHVNSKLTILLVFFQCMKELDDEQRTWLAGKVFSTLREEWTNIDACAAGELPVKELASVDYSAWEMSSCAPPSFFDRFSVLMDSSGRPKSTRAGGKSSASSVAVLWAAYAEVLLCAFYVIVKNVHCKGSNDQGVLEELFVTFTSSSLPVECFMPHLMLLLSRLPRDSISSSSELQDAVLINLDTELHFLAGFFTAEGMAVPAVVQIRSLDVLSFRLRNSAEEVPGSLNSNLEFSIREHIQETLAYVFVAVASPVKGVRRSAMRCFENLQTLQEKLVMASDGNRRAGEEGGILLKQKVFDRLLKAILEFKAQFIADRAHLELFLQMALGSGDGSVLAEGGEGGEGDMAEWGNLDRRFSGSSRKSIMKFLLSHALKMQPHAQVVLFTALSFAGHSLEKATATEELLWHLLERRRVLHLKKQASSMEAFPVKVELTTLSEMEVQLLESLIKLRDADVAAALTIHPPSTSGPPSLRTILPALEVEGGQVLDPAVTRPCFAAIACITSSFYSGLSCEAEDMLFTTLVNLIGSDTSEELKSAARSALSRVQVSSVTAFHILENLTSRRLADRTPDEPLQHSILMEVVPEKKKKKRLKAGVAEIVETEKVEPKASPVGTGGLRLATSLLEVLQWKSDIRKRELLVRPLFRLLQFIVEWMQTELKASQVDSLQQDPAAITGDAQIQLARLSAGMNYLAQLVSLVLESIAKEPVMTNETNVAGAQTKAIDLIEDEDPDPVGAFDVDIIVQCVQTAMDSGTRNHALALLAAVARLQPDQVLKHVLSVFAFIGQSSLTQDDSYSHRMVQQTLLAVVPSWLEHSHDISTLLKVFVEALPRVPVHRRLPLVLSLLRAVNEEKGLPVMLRLLFDLYLSGNAKTESRPSVLDEDDDVEDEDELMVERGDGSEWVMDFADLLCKQYGPRLRLQALAKLLHENGVKLAMASSENKGVVDRKSVAGGRKGGEEEDEREERKMVGWRMQGLMISFVAEQLQARVFLTTGEVATAEESLLQDFFVDIMEHVMVMVTAGSKYRAHERNNSAYHEAMDGLYDLLSVLHEVMPIHAYLKGIDSLIKLESSSIRQKVLSMFALALKEQEKESQSRRRRRNRLAKSEREKEAEGKLYNSLAAEIAKLLHGPKADSSVATRQSALVAIEVLAWRFGKLSREVFVKCIPAIVANLHHEDGVVVIHAVACVTAIIAACGPQALPHLPHFVDGLFKVGKRAANTINTRQAAKEEEENKKAAGHEKERASNFDILLNVVSAFEGILHALAAYFSPYVSELLDLVLLQPGVIACKTGGLDSKAEAVRTLAAEKIPPRLILDPMCNAYEKATASGERAVGALFKMVQIVASKFDRTAAAAYNGKLFDFFLRAFDMRRKRPPSFSDSSLFEGVEQAMMSAFAALVMKLSENTFRPLFVKTLEWAQAEIIDGVSTALHGDINRNIVFFGLIIELSERLRSVFVPYFKYVLDGVGFRLMGGNAAEEGESVKPKKKKRKNEGSGIQVEDWKLRFLIVTALHKCFLYDTVGFMDSTKFQRLLVPLASQLDVEPPPSAIPVSVPGEELEGQAATDADKERRDIPSVKEMDKALVDCLTQMAVTANSDLLWKPMNYEVLRYTRRDSVRARLLAIAIVTRMVDRLREEYLILLPETIPFLAELLEDGVLEVVAKCQQLVKTLETISGEKLSEYF